MKLTVHNHDLTDGTAKPWRDRACSRRVL